MVFIMSDPFDNYLRMYRMKARFSQDELAMLLGGVSGSRVSRFETGRRPVSIETALCFEVIFGVPVAELFAGVANEGASLIRENAIALLESVEQEQDGPAKELRVRCLREILKRTES